MANAVYNRFKRDIANGNIDLDTDNIKVLLVTSAYTPDVDAHATLSNVTNEVVGVGYTAGGQALANKTLTQDNANDRSVFDADDVTWTNSTITAHGAIIYKDTGSAATSPLITYKHFGSDKVSSAGNFTIQWDSTGILRFQ